jgi:hypothetical protein
VSVVVITVLTSGLIAKWLDESINLEVPSIGNINVIGVEAYWNIECTNKTELIDWGVIYPGESKDVTFYVKSISNKDVVLSFNLTNWVPPTISNYINLTWDYNEAPLSPGKVIPITFTLTVSSSDSFINYLVEKKVQEFSVDILIYPLKFF